MLPAVVGQAAVQFRFVTRPRYGPQSQTEWLTQLQLEILP